MTSANQAIEGRARLSFDLDDDETDNGKEEIVRKVEEISVRSGFVARASRPVKKRENFQQTEEQAVTRSRRTRPRTGRTYPFNTKLKQATYDKICDLADSATENEGRPVSLAEIIERAIYLLEQKTGTK